MTDQGLTIDTDTTFPVARDPASPLKPPPVFTEWRERPGLRRVQYKGQPTWLISRYEDIRAALVDERLSADNFAEDLRNATTSDDSAVIFARIDDPEHNRLRKMMTRDFTVRRIEAMRPSIQRMVDDLLDDMVDAGSPADLVRSFALPVPSIVISLLLGVPYEDHDFFQRHSAAALDSRLSDEEKGLATAAVFGYMSELVERKEREPGDDLISRLAVDYVATGQLNRATAVMNALILLAAGHETTASMIALGALTLLDHPDQWARLGQLDDPRSSAGVVEELMRYLTIVHSLVDRVAVEDLTIGGQPIRAGEMVLMNLPAGNWDPEFVADPGTFDTSRDARGHLGFGYGVHQCLGQHLARVEMQIALTALARRFPGLRLAVDPGDLEFLGFKEIYGVSELPVAW
ncbi:cytochrome P450 [Mycolicibacterium palauense]|uniref:cytochrome P450 n=1 Tax=Mycolicibacterium palauense TaxID=2034511 RepID=UPI000BFEB370|nr:cytochrome P450 [Mycolicibacterium palauense]